MQTYSDLALSAVGAALGGLAAVDHCRGWRISNCFSRWLSLVCRCSSLPLSLSYSFTLSVSCLVLLSSPLSQVLGVARSALLCSAAAKRAKGSSRDATATGQDKNVSGSPLLGCRGSHAASPSLSRSLALPFVLSLVFSLSLSLSLWCCAKGLSQEQLKSRVACCRSSCEGDSRPASARKCSNQVNLVHDRL